MIETIWSARMYIASVLLFAAGFLTLALDKNLVKKIIGINIMDTASYLLLTSMGYIEGRLSPIMVNNVVLPSENYVNPLPAGLVLTGIVVSVSVTALMLALTVKVYEHYHTLDLDRIYLLARQEEHERELRNEQEGRG